MNPPPALFSEIWAYLYDQIYVYIWGLCAYALIMFILIFLIFIQMLRQTIRPWPGQGLDPGSGPGPGQPLF